MLLPGWSYLQVWPSEPHDGWGPKERVLSFSCCTPCRVSPLPFELHLKTSIFVFWSLLSSSSSVFYHFLTFLFSARPFSVLQHTRVSLFRALSYDIYCSFCSEYSSSPNFPTSSPGQSSWSLTSQLPPQGSPSGSSKPGWRGPRGVPLNRVFKPLL